MGFRDNLVQFSKILNAKLKFREITEIDKTTQLTHLRILFACFSPNYNTDDTTVPSLYTQNI